jgi:hypothetical protein
MRNLITLVIAEKSLEAENMKKKEIQPPTAVRKDWLSQDHTGNSVPLFCSLGTLHKGGDK